jgi:hypothetical protein
MHRVVKKTNALVHNDGWAGCILMVWFTGGLEIKEKATFKIAKE